MRQRHSCISHGGNVDHNALRSWHAAMCNAQCNRSEDNLFWIRCKHVGSVWTEPNATTQFLFWCSNVFTVSIHLQKTMDFLISLIFGIVIVVFVATVAATGIYYIYRTRKDAAQESRGPPKKKKGIMGSKKTADDWVYLQDEQQQGLVDLASVPVQPQTRRPITSPDQVYPPVREQDDFLLESLDMDTPRSAIPPVWYHSNVDAIFGWFVDFVWMTKWLIDWSIDWLFVDWYLR